MRHIFWCKFLQWIWIALCSAQRLPPPSQDAWFRPPDGWEKAEPGAALKIREHAYDPIPIKNCIDTFQVLYRTSDTHGRPSWAVTTGFIPASQANCSESNIAACANGLVSYQIPYDTVNNDASASYLGQFGEPYGDIGLSLGRGWFVTSPDYMGPNASFTAGVQAGHATLDSIRATLAVGPSFGLRKTAGVAIWGYSAGGQAAGFAAELAAEYAPDLKIAGAIVGGPPPDIASSIPLANKRDVSGLIVASLLGMTHQHPEAYLALLATVKTEGPHNITGFITPYFLTGLQSLRYFSEQDIFNYFPNGSDSVWTPAMKRIFELDGVMGRHGTPNMPIFVYKALHDDFSIPEEVDALVENWCDAGVNVLYHRNRIGGHNPELTNGRQRALNYLGAVLSGNTTAIEIPDKGCLTVDLEDEVDPDTIW
jgi:hypothetical protein